MSVNRLLVYIQYIQISQPNGLQPPAQTFLVRGQGRDFRQVMGPTNQTLWQQLTNTEYITFYISSSRLLTYISYILIRYGNDNMLNMFCGSLIGHFWQELNNTVHIKFQFREVYHRNEYILDQRCSQGVFRGVHCLDTSGSNWRTQDKKSVIRILYRICYLFNRYQKK